MSYKSAAQFDVLRVIAYGSITSSYVQLGASLSSRAVLVAFTNSTNGVVYVSTDGSTDMLAIPAGTGKVFDVRTNAPNQTDYLLPIGTSFYIKYAGSAPTSGSFYIEAVLAED